jgi:hypothetical protein
VLLASCHSGTGTRELILDRASLRDIPSEMSLEKDLWPSRFCIRPRYLAPPADIALRADEVFGEELPLRKFGRLAGLNHVLWAACRSDQYSADADIGGKPAGAFTYFFCKHIRNTEGKIARADLIKRICASLKHEGFSQLPHI